MVRVGVVGCAHGQFDAMYAHIDRVNAAAARDGDAPVELLLCCGDVQSLRNSADLECEACPRRYRHMNEFHEYYSGKKRASVLTIVIGGNHEASNYLQELHYGGWIAPNIFYLGAAGVVNVLGLRIAGLSGIYDPKNYRRGHHERAPYTKKSMYSVYHTRESEVYQLSHLTGTIDVMLSHDWPRKIEDYGDKETLMRLRPSFRASIEEDNFGSYAGETLLHTLRPKHWFAGHMHIRFEANVHHNEHSSQPAVTQFLALDKCLASRPWFEFVDIEPSQQPSGGITGRTGQFPRVYTDNEWLAILRATHHLMSRSANEIRMPTERTKIEKHDREWVRHRLEEKRQSDRGVGEWPQDFQVTAPSLDDEHEHIFGEGELGNPQTDSLLELLELAHVVTSPYCPDGIPDDDSDDSEANSRDEWDVAGSSSGDEDARDSSRGRGSANDAFLESLEMLSIGNFNF